MQQTNTLSPSLPNLDQDPAVAAWWSPQQVYAPMPQAFAPPAPVVQRPMPIDLFLGVAASFLFSIIAPFLWAHCRQRVYDIDRGGFDPSYRSAYATARTITGIISLITLVLVCVLVRNTVVADHAYHY